MDGVPEANELNPGGYVPLNADNDNRSQVTLRLAQTQDRAVNPIPAENNLVSITLQVAAPGVQNPTARLSVTHNGRGRIRVWDTRTKANEIVLPATWAIAQVPRNLFVEGVEHSAAERDTQLTLDLLSNGQPVANRSDAIAVTVTPVVRDLRVIVTAGAAPGITLRFVGRRRQVVLNSAVGGAAGRNALTYRAEVLRTRLAGRLRLSQKVRVLSNLAGGGGANVVAAGIVRSWDFAPPNTGAFLMDSTPAMFPLYSIVPRQINLPGNVQRAEDVDTPVVVVGDGPGGFFDMLPPANDRTDIDVTYEFTTYAVWEYDDGTIIYLAKTDPWTVRFQGTVTPAVNRVGYAFARGAANGAAGTVGFTLDNTTPPEAVQPAPPPPPPTANDQTDWR